MKQREVFDYVTVCTACLLHVDLLYYEAPGSYLVLIAVRCLAGQQLM